MFPLMFFREAVLESPHDGLRRSHRPICLSEVAPNRCDSIALFKKTGDLHASRLRDGSDLLEILYEQDVALAQFGTRVDEPRGVWSHGNARLVWGVLHQKDR